MLYDREDLSFRIDTVARVRHCEGDFTVKKRPYAAIACKTVGKTEYEIGGEHFTVGPREILFLPADVDYRVKYTENDGIVVHLSDCNYHRAEHIRTENGEMIERLFRELLEKWTRNHAVNEAKACLYDILFRLSEGGRTENRLFRSAVDCMEKRLSDHALSVKAIADALHASRSALQRAFLTQVGMPPVRYLLHLRIERATLLLSEGNFSVKEIAAATGFSDEKYFSRAFKRMYGYPPTKLREGIIL